MEVTKVGMLIEKVKMHPFLYDMTNLDYKNMRRKNEVWEEIAASLCLGSGSELKSKWKNLRDNYSKYLRSQKEQNGQKSSLLHRYKYWPWAHQMDFLKPYLAAAKSEPNSQDIENDSDANEKETADLTPSEKELENSSNSFRISPHEEPSTQPSNSTEFPGKTLCHNRKRPFRNDECHSIEKHDNCSKYRRVGLDIDFDDVDFIFLGYAKILKTFSARRKALTKYKMAKIMLEAELEEEEENSYMHRGDSTTENSPYVNANCPLSAVDIKTEEEISSVIDTSEKYDNN